MPLTELPWTLLSPMLTGSSAVDVPQLNVYDHRQCEDFLEAYGFDWNDPLDQAAVGRLRSKALEFLDTQLLHDEPELDAEFPVALRQEVDVRNIMMLASKGFGSATQMWACTLLRVMHTLAHTSSYFNSRYRHYIKDSILGRFTDHIYTDNGKQILGRKNGIPLVSFETRGEKSTISLALKLLQKPDNVATDIFDWVGLRFVTHDRYDALRVLEYLQEHNIVTFAHVRPGRSRNTLIDIDRMRADLSKLHEQYRKSAIAGHEVDAEIRRRVQGYPYPSPPQKSYNPLSAVRYHSIQFTCVQRMRAMEEQASGPRPVSVPVKRFLASIPMPALPEGPAGKVMDEMRRRRDDLLQDREHLHFLFPYEVQVMDRRSYEDTHRGLASHEVYKERQRHAVKRRLWGDRVPEESPRIAERIARERGA